MNVVALLCCRHRQRGVRVVAVRQNLTDHSASISQMLGVCSIFPLHLPFLMFPLESRALDIGLVDLGTTRRIDSMEKSALCILKF